MIGIIRGRADYCTVLRQRPWWIYPNVGSILLILVDVKLGCVGSERKRALSSFERWKECVILSIVSCRHNFSANVKASHPLPESELLFQVRFRRSHQALVTEQVVDWCALPCSLPVFPAR